MPQSEFLPVKPLYIEGPEPARVRLDGPALVIVREGRAPRRYPLGRISRVVAGGRIHWDHEALVACLDHGVTITLLAPDGSARGFGLPACDPATRDNQRLEEFLSRPDWRSLYDNWLRAYERREILYLGKLLRARFADLRAPAVQETLEARWARRFPAAVVRGLKTQLDGLLAGRIAQHLELRKYAPPLLADRRPGFHFPRDLARLLGWRLWADLDRYLRRLAVARRSPSPENCRHELRTLYETLHRREDRRIAYAIDNFRFWLGGLP